MIDNKSTVLKEVTVKNNFQNAGTTKAVHKNIDQKIMTAFILTEY